MIHEMIIYFNYRYREEQSYGTFRFRPLAGILRHYTRIP